MWTAYSAMFTKATFTCTSGQCFSASKCSDLYANMMSITVQIDGTAYVIPPMGYTQTANANMGENKCYLAVTNGAADTTIVLGM